MKQLGVVVGVCALVVVGAACGSSAKQSVATTATTTTSIAGIKVPTIPPGQQTFPTSPSSVLPTLSLPPTTVQAATPTSCVGLKDPLPQGSPTFSVPAGPLPTKLGIQDLKVGTGAVVAKDATVNVNYVGVACSTGKIFDSSYAHGGPQQFPLSGVIPGFGNGIPGMKVGGVRLLSIPADQAYGPNPPPGSGIAVNDPLFFLVEVTGVG